MVLLVKCQDLPSAESEHVGNKESAEKSIGMSPGVNKSIALLPELGMFSESR